MTIDKKEDGLQYAYKHRLVKKTDVGWVRVNDHYDRASIYALFEKTIELSRHTCSGLAVLEYIEGAWVVDINWLEKYMNNNRHLLTWNPKQNSADKELLKNKN